MTGDRTPRPFGLEYRLYAEKPQNYAFANKVFSVRLDAKTVPVCTPSVLRTHKYDGADVSKHLDIHKRWNNALYDGPYYEWTSTPFKNEKHRAMWLHADFGIK